VIGSPIGDARTSGVTAVEQVGSTVHRAQGSWSPAVHALLVHLEQRGFPGAPRFLGVDNQGREILDFVPGDTAESLGAVASDQLLTSAAALLRGFHDATVAGELLTRGGWQLPPVEPVEVICHNDAAPYNTIVRDGMAVGFIDFDTAAPGPRAWDLAYALYRFVPLSRGFGDAPQQGERAARFLEAYGASQVDAMEAIRLVPKRLAALVGFMRARADAGNSAYAAHIARGDADEYRRDIAYATANISAWVAARR